MNKEQESTQNIADEILNVEPQLILLNDDVNAYGYVIDCLMKVCGHSQEQAESCALITHYKGKCAVMSGSFDKLIPYHMMLLLDCRLLAVIE